MGMPTRPADHASVAQPLELIGRRAELARLVARVASREARLLTLTGVAGIGKTRLALAAAEALAGQFADGVRLVDLVPVERAVAVIPQMGRALGLRDHGGSVSMRRLTDYLGRRDVLCFAAGETRQRIVTACRDAGVPVKTLPSVHELIAGDLRLARQLREVQVEDVLGREAVDLDLERIAAYLAGETVLITGAGGSIGSELCRQIAAVRPERLILVEHAENPLFEMKRRS